MTDSPRPPRWLLAALAVALAAHAALVAWQFPTRLALAGEPLATGDSAITLGKSWDVARGREAGGLVGYSPSFMAGYPYGLWNSVGHRGYELGTAWLPFGTPPQRYHATAVAMAALTPLLLGLAALGGGLGGRAAAGCVAFACVVVQLCDPVSYFWTFGNAAFPFASALAAAATAFGVAGGPGRTPGRTPARTLGRAAFAGLLAGAAVWAHTVAAVPLACGGLAAAVVSRRAGAGWPAVGAAGSVVAVVAAAVVVPGHWHLLAHLAERAPMAAEPLPSGVKYLVMDLLNDRAYRHALDRRPLFHVLLVLATWQGVADWRARSGRSEVLWLAGLLTLAFGYAAGHVPALRQLQPYRFVVSGDLMLAVPAALGLARLGRAARAANPPGRAAFAATALALAPGLLGYGWDAAGRAPAAGLDADAKRAVEGVRAQPAGGRVLCEPGALGCLLPHLTGREVVGGGVSGQAVVVQNWCHVDADRAFGGPTARLGPDAFLRLCRLLDFRLLVVESAAVEALVTATPSAFERGPDFGRLRTYRTRPGQAPEIWGGCYEGKVTATHNRVAIADAPAGGVVLNYHYARGFDGGPGVAVEPAEVAGAAAPFLKVTTDTPRQLVVLTFRP